MSLGKVAIFSPNPQSLYTTTVCELLKRKDLKIEAIFVKRFTISRLREEFSRDGFRLLKKIWKKLILKEKAYSKYKNIDTIMSFRKAKKITLRKVNELKSEGIDVYYVNDFNNILVENKLKEKMVDLVVFTGGGLIKKNILEVSGSGVLNCHMGKLPDYRGMDVIEWPLFKKDYQNIGYTIHFMDEGLDTGKILKYFNVKLQDNESILSLRARFEPMMTNDFVNTIIEYLNNKIEPNKQRKEEGKQYYIMDKILYKISEQRLQDYKEW